MKKLFIGLILFGVALFAVAVCVQLYLTFKVESFLVDSVENSVDCMNNRTCRIENDCVLFKGFEPEFAENANSDTRSQFNHLFNGLFSTLDIPESSTNDLPPQKRVNHTHTSRMYKFGFLWVCNAADSATRDLIGEEEYVYDGDIPDEEACFGGCTKMYSDLSKAFIRGMNEASLDVPSPTQVPND